MIPRPEVPDPLLERAEWAPLHGRWGFAPDRRNQGLAEEWFRRDALPGTIEVPFCVEAEASGAASAASAGRFWYLRRFTVPPGWAGRETWLRIGAADHACAGWVNGVSVGHHEGGWTPAAWRLDPGLRPGENVLVIRVEETRRPALPRGKQTHLPFAHTVFYPPFSGIWQPVSLEARGETHIAALAARTAPGGEGFQVRVRLAGDPRGTVRLRLRHPDGAPDASVEVPVTGPDLEVPVVPRRVARWSPATPHLYGIEAEVWQDDVAVDRVRSYGGLRHLEVSGGRLWLDGCPLYQRFVLYQPYWPGGWATAPSDEAMRADLEWVRRLGFNGLRIHQVVPDPRLLYGCDVLGLLAWAELPSPFPLARVDRGAFRALLEESVQRDAGHPCIVARVLFNESWGILPILWSEGWRAWVREMAALARRLDPGTPVVDNSGFDHLDTDLLDVHHYLADPAAVARLYAALARPDRMDGAAWRHLYMLLPSRVHVGPLAPGGAWTGQPVVVSECGGHGFGPYGGGGLPREEALRRTLEAIRAAPHLQGFCLTQLCDVAQERNGLLDFERRPRVDPETVRALVTA